MRSTHGRNVDADYHQEVVARLTNERARTERVAEQMADTLRAVLFAVDCERPYPWQGGALKQQIREDLTAYDLLGLDDRG